MNERIEGLWWQARIGYNNQNCDPEVLAKFAQLIVRECMDVIEDSEGYSQYFPHVTENIEKHFGVEE